MLRRHQWSVMLCATVVAVSLSGCGSDSTAPEPPPPPPPPSYPALAGAFTISIAFDGLSPFDANGSGTITFSQASREAPDLTGSLTAVITIGGESDALSLSLYQATIQQNGQIEFQWGPPQGTATWVFHGTLNASGNSIAGTHQLSGTSGAATGTWTANRQ